MNKKENSMLGYDGQIAFPTTNYTEGPECFQSARKKRRRWKRIGHVLRMQPSEDPRKVLKWLPVGRRKVGRPRTTWCRMAQKERDEELGWKSWEEAREVATKPD